MKETGYTNPRDMYTWTMYYNSPLPKGYILYCVGQEGRGVGGGGGGGRGREKEKLVYRAQLSMGRGARIMPALTHTAFIFELCILQSLLLGLQH